MNKLIKNIHLNQIVVNTPLYFNTFLSKIYHSNVYLKREDLQTVRSFKIRGAYNKIINNLDNKTYVTASAGNHAQGVAYTCNYYKFNHHIFIPENTPQQKIDRIKYFGGDYLNLHVIDDSLNNLLKISKDYSDNNDFLFVHPFSDIDVIKGQGTILSEILDTIIPDIIICPIGGGGLLSGIIDYKSQLGIDLKIIGAEPEGSCGFHDSLKAGELITLENNDTFVDGASIDKIGEIPFNICMKHRDEIDIVKINNNHLCDTLIKLYQNEGLIAELAGGLSISALDVIDPDIIKGQNVVCIVSGGNNDIMRYNDFIKRANIYRNSK